MTESSTPSADRDRDRFYVQKDKHPTFQRLSKDEEAPFKTMKDAWVLSAALGFRMGMSQPMRGGTQHVGFWHYLSLQEDIPLLQAMAVATTGDIAVLGERGEVIRIAEEFANSGVELLVELERVESAATIRSIAATIVESCNRQRTASSRTAQSAAAPTASIAELISRGEGRRVEFKSSARWNLRRNDKDQAVEEVIAAAVAGFMNADGGTLLIGVNDEGNVVGLTNDYSTLGARQNRDGFENWLTTMLSGSLGRPAMVHVTVTFEEIDGGDVCRVDVAPSPAPVHMATKQSGREVTRFFVRMNNSTRELNGRETIDYIQRHWTS